jgi:3(or 17)beta-hydroxysteroid dehydrogenase
VLINAASVSFPSDTLEECTADTWQRTLAINLDGTFLGCQHAVRVMQASHGGSIINIASILGRVGSGASTAYTASMAGVRLLTRSVALHCAKERNNIRCNSICPGYAMPTRDGTQKTDASTTPDIRGLAVYLASDSSASCTGADFVIDSGFSAS